MFNCFFWSWWNYLITPPSFQTSSTSLLLSLACRCLSSSTRGSIIKYSASWSNWGRIPCIRSSDITTWKQTIIQSEIIFLKKAYLWRPEELQNILENLRISIQESVSLAIPPRWYFPVDHSRQNRMRIAQKCTLKICITLIIKITFDLTLSVVNFTPPTFMRTISSSSTMGFICIFWILVRFERGSNIKISIVKNTENRRNLIANIGKNGCIQKKG